MAESLSWLHLTDLHQGHGTGSQASLWPQIEQIFLRDLEKLHKRCGPFDLVLFTGDLTQRGSPEEFHQLDGVLGKLLAHLRRLGSQPLLLCVPGNHDLSRPSAREPAVRLLCDKFHADAELREEFFTDATSTYRRVVEQSFSAYAAWWAGQGPLQPQALAPGLLPGEFAATVHKDGLSVGVLGLNTAFLQLTGGDFSGRLAVHPLQFHTPCGGDGPSWAERHDLCLLLTHHPPEWLHPEAARDLYGEIAKPGRFAVHLFGHLHEGSSRTLSVGGGAPVRQWQGGSLFGLESFGERGAQRSHGYAAGRIEVRGREARLRLWPRRAVRDPLGPFRLVPDYSAFDLEDDQGTRAELMPLTRPEHDAPPAAPPRSVPGPGGPYDRDLYVPRAKEEPIALSLLRAPGAPVLLWGPHGAGKTWLLQHLLAQVPAEDGGQVVALDLSAFDREHLASLDAFAHEFAARIVLRLGGDRAQVDRAWGTFGSPGSKLNRLMEQLVLRRTAGRLVLGIDGADALFGSSFEDDFFGFLRAWADDQEEPWLRLRLLLSVSITPAMLTRKKTQSPLLNRVIPIHLLDFTVEQVQLLVERCGRRPGRRDVGALLQLLGGNPYLTQLALHHASQHGFALRELCDDAEVAERVFGEHLQGLAAWLGGEPALLAALRHVLSAAPGAVDADAFEHLHRRGLLEHDEAEGYRVRYKLYEDFLRGLCRSS